MRLMKLSGKTASGKTTLLREIEKNSTANISAFFKELVTTTPVEQFINWNSESPDVLVLVDGCSDEVLKRIGDFGFRENIGGNVTVIVAVTEPVWSR